MQIANHVFTAPARKKDFGLARPKPAEEAPVLEPLTMGEVMLKCGAIGAATLGGLAAIGAYSPTNGPGLAGMAAGVGMLAAGVGQSHDGMEVAGGMIASCITGVLTRLAVGAGPALGAQLGLGPVAGAVGMGVIGGTLGAAGVYVMFRLADVKAAPAR